MGLQQLLAAIESRHSLQYVRAGLLDTPEAFCVQSYEQIPDLGHALSGDHNQEPFWLLVDSHADVSVRSVPQRRGGTRYAIDQRENPRSITFSAGGVHGDSSIIDGSIGTCTDDAASRELLNSFAREVRKQFQRIKAFFVGPEAEQLLDAGYRLTTSVKAPRETDLSRH